LNLHGVLSAVAVGPAMWREVAWLRGFSRWRAPLAAFVHKRLDVKRAPRPGLLLDRKTKQLYGGAWDLVRGRRDPHARCEQDVDRRRLLRGNER
jgi:hypothetical protein